MLQAIEKLILEFARWFYSLPPMAGIFTLGVITVVLLIVQFQRQKETFVPGLLACLFAYLELYHYLWPDKAIRYIDGVIASMNVPVDGRTPVPAVEFLFNLGVGPYATRSILEECVFVAFLAYIASVFFHGLRETPVAPTAQRGGLLSMFTNKSRRPKRSEHNELGSGDLANNEQISRWVTPSGEDCDTQLMVEELRGSEGVAYKKAIIHIPRGERNRHILAVAKTGSGKTTKLILPILYNDCMDPIRSTIVIDSKPEMWRKLAGMTRKYAPEKEILLFNPLDTARSLSWNILEKIETDTDAKLIANTIIQATDNPAARQDTPFFRNNALAVLNAIFVGLLNDPDEVLFFFWVHQLIQSGNKN
ncbi:MAG: hypothetical protein D6808_02460, partial [Candidatus Dadabacteria bacterium]